MSPKLIFIVIGLLLFSSCSSNTYDDVQENDNEQTPELVTYQEVRPILNSACVQCHSNPPQNGAPMSLETFESAREAVLTRGLLNSISIPDGDPGLMPLGGPRLPQNTIDLIFQWEEDGLLNN